MVDASFAGFQARSPTVGAYQPASLVDALMWRRKVADSFYKIPRKVHRCADYRYLNGNAVKLLNALACQFTGHNNGNLTAAWTVMRDQHGFRSPTTLDRARKGLLDANLIKLSRQGGLGRCSLYAVTWLQINPCDGKLDIQPTTLPPRIDWNQQLRSEPARAKHRKTPTGASRLCWRTITSRAF